MMGRIREAWVHDIVTAISAARGHARLLAEQRPEINAMCRRLDDDLLRAQKAFLEAAKPIVRPTISIKQHASLERIQGQSQTAHD